MQRAYPKVKSYAEGVALTSLLVDLADARLSRFGVRVASPREASARGAHIVLACPGASDVVAALLARGVIVDFREPGLVRVGCSPLTTRFVDVWDAVEALVGVLAAG